MATHSTTKLPNGHTLTIVEKGPHSFSVQERDASGGNPRHVKQAYHLSEAQAYVRARQHGKSRRQLLAERRAKDNQRKDAKLAALGPRPRPRRGGPGDRHE